MSELNASPMTAERLDLLRCYVATFPDAARNSGVAELLAEVERLRAQLPPTMQHCTIRFIECPKGHGRLTAANWEQHGCHWCEVERLRAVLARIASWEEGPAAPGNFDEFAASRIARGALKGG